MSKLALFKKPFTNILDKIDAFFESRKQSERTIIAYTPGLAMLYVIYMYLFPYMEDMHKKMKNDYMNVTNQIITTQNQLSSISTSNRIGNLQNEIAQVKVKIEEEGKERLRVEDKLFLLSNSQRDWHQILDFISESAKKRKVEIGSIDSVVAQKSDFYGLFKSDIIVKGSSGFYSLLQFVDDIETFGDYIEIRKIEFSSDKKIEFEITLEEWKVEI